MTVPLQGDTGQREKRGQDKDREKIMMLDSKAFTSGREPTDDLWQAMFTQRAIRYWEDRPVPRELLERVIQAASKAPSGSNSQPWVFVVVDDDGQRASVGEALKRVYDAAEPLKHMIAEGQKTGDKTQRLMLKGAQNFFTSLSGAPAIIVPCLYKLSSPTPDPGSLEAGSSIYMAVQNLMLSARALGLGTVMTTAQTLIDQPLRQALDIPGEAYPVALIPIGYPDANFGPTTRKGVGEILRWNTWS